MPLSAVIAINEGADRWTEKVRKARFVNGYEVRATFGKYSRNFWDEPHEIDESASYGMLLFVFNNV